MGGNLILTCCGTNCGGGINPLLTELVVRNLALLEDARLEFAPGFLALTGETGAGKSILLDALGLTLGRRADPAQIRQGADRLTVSARFRLSGKKLAALLRELGLEGDDDTLVLRRDVDAGGKSRAFVNDHPVSAATLARLGERLVFVHGQNEHQLLLKPAEQRDAVDDFGSLSAERAAVAEAHAAWRAAVEERDALALSEQERSQRLDLYRFQKQELDQADPRAEEEAELESLLPQLKNAARLRALAQEAHGRLHAQEESALDLLRRVQKDFDALRGLGAPLGEEAELLAGALIPLEDVSRRLESYAEGLDVDPAKLDALLGRLDLLGKLKRKYGPTLADVVAHRTRVDEALSRLENLEGRGQDATRRVEETRAELSRRSAVLSEARQRAAKKMAAAVQKEFKDVGLPHARFDIAVESAPDAFTESGVDRVTFLFAPNPGEGHRPLADTASGGELSRVMLALESAAARTDGPPVMIFDEIDAGVGGTLGAVLGKKLDQLARGRQVLCITHLATIAARADGHWAVSKEVKNDRTRTRVRCLTEEERVVEIARLFGATGDTADVGLRHARELLGSSRRA